MILNFLCPLAIIQEQSGIGEKGNWESTYFKKFNLNLILTCKRFNVWEVLIGKAMEGNRLNLVVSIKLEISHSSENDGIDQIL